MTDTPMLDPSADDVTPISSTKEDQIRRVHRMAVMEPDDNNDTVLPDKTNTIPEAIIYLARMCLGSGVTAMHDSYKQCGLWTALCLNIVLGVAVTLSMYELVKSSQKMCRHIHVSAMTYPDLAEAALELSPWAWMRAYSRCFRHLVEVIMCVELFGSCCVYQVIIARILMQLVEGTERVSGVPAVRLYILSLLLPCIFLSVITNIKYLVPFSVVADIFILVLAATTIYYSSLTIEVSLIGMPVFYSVPGLFEFIGVCLYSIEGLGAILAVENSMIDPKKLPLVLFGGMSIVVSVGMVIGFFGYWAFQEQCEAPITMNFPISDFSIILKMFTGLMTFIVFGLNFWVLFNMVWCYLSSWYDIDKLWLWERGYRISLLIMNTTVALAMPSVTKLIAVLGSLCLSHTGFIFPAFISLTLNWKDHGPGTFYWRVWKTLTFILFGAVLCVVGTALNTWGLILEVMELSKR